MNKTSTLGTLEYVVSNVMIAGIFVMSQLLIIFKWLLFPSFLYKLKISDFLC